MTSFNYSASIHEINPKLRSLKIVYYCFCDKIICCWDWPGGRWSTNLSVLVWAFYWQQYSPPPEKTPGLTLTNFPPSNHHHSPSSTHGQRNKSGNLSTFYILNIILLERLSIWNVNNSRYLEKILLFRVSVY